MYGDFVGLELPTSASDRDDVFLYASLSITVYCQSKFSGLLSEHRVIHSYSYSPASTRRTKALPSLAAP